MHTMLQLHPDLRMRVLESSLSIEKMDSVVELTYFATVSWRSKFLYICIRCFISNNFHLSAQKL